MQPKTIIILSVILFLFGVFIFEFFTEDVTIDDPIIKQVSAQLAEEGFEVIDVETTWLGRYKIEAHSGEFEREIVVAPGAGTFLRDDISPLTESESDDN